MVVQSVFFRYSRGVSLWGAGPRKVPIHPRTTRLPDCIVEDT